MEPNSLKRKVSFAGLHRLAAGVALLAFLVTLIAGLMAEVRISTILLRSVLVMLAVGVISRLVITILASYEEMNSGKA